VQINYGIKTGFNEAFIIDGKTKEELIAKSPKNAEIIRPILLGKNIKQFTYEWDNLWLINTHNGLKNKLSRIDVQNEYPSVFEYLKSFELSLVKRFDSGDHWTNLRNCAYLEAFEKPKIAWGNLALNPQFAFIEESYFINAPSPFFVTDDLYLLAILNSKLSGYYIKSLGVTRNGGYFEFKPMFVEQLPIPIISKAEKEIFIEFVKQIIDLKKAKKDTSEFENEIDSLVYKLYNLNNIEIEHINKIHKHY